MSIFDQTGESAYVHAARNSFSAFADRHQLSMSFLARLNDHMVDRRVLFLHGLGGNGKSLMLRYLQNRCAVQLNPSDWGLLQRLPLDMAMERVQNGQYDDGVRLANALLDFGERPKGYDHPLEVLSGLFILRRQLAKYSVPTPRFDFTAVTYLQKAGLRYEQIIPDLFATEEIELTLRLADVLSSLPFASTGIALLRLFEKSAEEKLSKWKMTHSLSAEDIARVLESPAEPDLADLLPTFFADDLNTAVSSEGSRSRIVLFFDTHEAFWGEEFLPDSGGWSPALARDKWVRLLIGSLDTSQGIVVVVAGRRPPPWPYAAQFAIPEAYLDIKEIRGLSPADSEWYLDKCGIKDRVLQQTVIKYASSDVHEVHPYMLGLCTDLLAAEAESGTDSSVFAEKLAQGIDSRRRLLVERLLSTISEDAQAAVIAVAACRSFDLDLFRYLAGRLKFHGSNSDFRRLTNFSFILVAPDVTQLGSGQPIPPSYSVHQLLRRELHTTFAQDTAGAHRALVDFYGVSGDAASQAERSLHLAHTDRLAGLAEWCANVDRYLEYGRFRDAYAFVSVLQEMLSIMEQSPPIGGAGDRMYFRVGECYLGLGSLPEAEALLGRLGANSAEAYLLRADLLFYGCKFEEAERTARAGLEEVSGPERARLEFRLAKILLYRGEFAECKRVLDARDMAHLILADHRDDTSPAILGGEVMLFSGDLASIHR